MLSFLAQNVSESELPSYFPWRCPTPSENTFLGTTDSIKDLSFFWCLSGGLLLCRTANGRTDRFPYLDMHALVLVRTVVRQMTTVVAPLDVSWFCSQIRQNSSTVFFCFCFLFVFWVMFWFCSWTAEVVPPRKSNFLLPVKSSECGQCLVQRI